MRERFREDPEVAVGAMVLAVVAAVLLIVVSGVMSNPFGGAEKRTVRAVFASAQQLAPGDDVRIDGISSGEVKGIALDRSGRGSVVTMEVEDDAGALDDDARATIQYKTVLGGTFYVDLELGTSGRSLEGATIPVARTQNQVELDDVLDFAKGGAQEGLQILPGEMADALRGEQDVRALFDTIEEISPGAEKGLNAVRGEQLDRDLQDLVANTARTLSALDAPGDHIRDVIEGGAATLQTTAARDEDVRRTLSLMPPTSQEINTTLNRVTRTLDVADPLIEKLQGSARFVAPTFAAVRPTLVDADVLLKRARPLLSSLRPAASSVAAASRRALPLFNGLDPSIDRLEQRNLPAVLEVDPVTEKPTSTMIGGTFTQLGGVAGQMDGQGHLLRFPATFGSAPLNSLPCQLYFNDPNSDQLIACNDFTQAVQTFFNYTPTGPLEGSADADQPGEGTK